VGNRKRSHSHHQKCWFVTFTFEIFESFQAVLKLQN
jgi:hypothetical protein